ncbi:MAG: hypothetical protein ACPG6R_11815 [Aequoribacter sp.]|uniref:hypothetical protein n=1 Tax=Aequoribacter sp. TaxID=2847771 RepID=UPI003C358972
MNEQDKPEFTKALKAFLFTLDGTHSPDGMVMAHYWDTLSKFDKEKVLKALAALASESEEHIRPAQVVAKITGKKTVKAKSEFDSIMSLVQQYGIEGARDRVDKESKAWGVIKKMGGLSAFNTTDLGSVRAAFYRGFDQ